MKSAVPNSASKHDDLIYDVGMHRGEDTEFYMRKGFRCVAFEADPESADYCRAKFAEFINNGRLIIIEGAIVDPQSVAAGQKAIKFFKNENLAVLGTLSTEWAEQNARLGSVSKTIEVGIVDFEEAIREHGMPHYLKIDIEGNDIFCLEALSHFNERPDYVSFEADRTKFRKNKNEIACLLALGYDSFQAIEQSEGVLAQQPPFPAREGGYVPHRFDKNCSGLFGAELGDADWKSEKEILSLCRAIQLGHFLVGNNGLMANWRFKGSKRLQWYARRLVRRFTKTAVPGWHDIHARHRSAGKRPKVA